eukprot:TRINITY_DN75385_c0_g1_i1.p1 TRINITY_DN75385_c0_g1~~TRINITY_DN75385_c0_g1_i1.p1  ORF type:complete len:374 (+),score=97.49 TRINITY_DN75385_c0_g1_i1:87-1124(+)
MMRQSRALWCASGYVAHSMPRCDASASGWLKQRWGHQRWTHRRLSEDTALFDAAFRIRDDVNELDSKGYAGPRVYVTAIRLLLKGHRLSFAREMLEQFCHTQRCKPPLQMLTPFLTFHGKRGDVVALHGVWKEMLQHRHAWAHDRALYTTFIASFTKAGLRKEARRVFHLAKQVVEPDKPLVMAYVSAHESYAEAKAAADIYKEVLESPFRQLALLRVCKDVRDAANAEVVFASLRHPSPDAWSFRLQCASDMPQVEHVFREMVQQGVTPRPGCFTRAITLAPTVKEAMHYFNLADRYYVANQQVGGVMLRRLIDAKEYALCDALFERFNSLRFTPEARRLKRLR